MKPRDRDQPTLPSVLQLVLEFVRNGCALGLQPAQIGVVDDVLHGANPAPDQAVVRSNETLAVKSVICVSSVIAPVRP